MDGWRNLKRLRSPLFSRQVRNLHRSIYRPRIKFSLPFLPPLRFPVRLPIRIRRASQSLKSTGSALSTNVERKDSSPAPDDLRVCERREEFRPLSRREPSALRQLNIWLRIWWQRGSLAPTKDGCLCLGASRSASETARAEGSAPNDSKQATSHSRPIAQLSDTPCRVISRLSHWKQSKRTLTKWHTNSRERSLEATVNLTYFLGRDSGGTIPLAR